MTLCNMKNSVFLGEFLPTILGAAAFVRLTHRAGQTRIRLGHPWPSMGEDSQTSP
ncbi:hypothetical protein BDZ94DRAFT_1249360 [Collybia nuda]|uniref:Uncharacterized protein n=1 Tax=Collybia nuda TaxID=64659 RepID=A0A9P5YGX2_9AGAR|nr:hypothetical protein BDZ94DRAFT_1249360 [Collybia nuda]